MQMDFENMSDENLLKRTEAIAANLRIATTALLYHLGEVERRRLFAKVGCSSLFDYCVRVLKMSEPQAGRRVSAARALREFPEIEAKINSGALSLSAINQAQSFFRNESKSNAPLDDVGRRDILRELENKSARETEKFLLSRSCQPEEFIRERVRQVSKTVTEIRCGLDEETMDNLMRLREIWSYELPEANHSQLIKKSSSFCREKLDPQNRVFRKLLRNKGVMNEDTLQHSATPTSESHCVTKLNADKDQKTGEQSQFSQPNDRSKEANFQTNDSTSFAPESPVSQRRSRHIPADVRHKVWARDKGCCTYVDPDSGRRCESRVRLNLDHIVPFAKGGPHTAPNLRLRCFAHNQWHAIEKFGDEVLKYTEDRD